MFNTVSVDSLWPFPDLFLFYKCCVFKFKRQTCSIRPQRCSVNKQAQERWALVFAKVSLLTKVSGGFFFLVLSGRLEPAPDSRGFCWRQEHLSVNFTLS